MKYRLAVVTSLLALAPCAFAQQTYEGLIDRNEVLVRVAITLSDDANPMGLVRFSDPWSCQLIIKPVSSSDTQTTYAIRPNSAGRCQRLSDGQMILNRKEDKVSAVFYPRGETKPYLSVYELREKQP